MRGVDGDEDCHRSHALRGNAARTWERGRPRPHAGETPAIPDDAFPWRPWERCKIRKWNVVNEISCYAPNHNKESAHVH